MKSSPSLRGSRDPARARRRPSPAAPPARNARSAPPHRSRKTPPRPASTAGSSSSAADRPGLRLVVGSDDHVGERSRRNDRAPSPSVIGRLQTMTPPKGACRSVSKAFSQASRRSSSPSAQPTPQGLVCLRIRHGRAPELGGQAPRRPRCRGRWCTMSSLPCSLVKYSAKLSVEGAPSGGGSRRSAARSSSGRLTL